MTSLKHIAVGLAFAISITVAGSSLAQTKAKNAGANSENQPVLEKAIENSKKKLKDEIHRVPGLKYDDISAISGKIPGRVQIPDPTSKDFATRAISVPGGLVSRECKHFARGFIARRLAIKDAGLTQEAALSKIIGHLHEQRLAYVKIAGSRGLKRSDGAIHDANCPVCGPLNVVEIECHKAAVKRSPIRQLVMFDYDSDVLRGGYFATTRQIKTLLDEDPGLQVALIGRASLPGGPVPNFELSARRITSVWQGLAKAGVPVDRIVAIPIGEDEPHIDLQLAIDYGLQSEFAKIGQKPLNQSVYIVVFRPNEKFPLDALTTSSVQRSDAMIEVTVTNSDNSVFLQGVTVTATSAQTMRSTWIITDDRGKGYLRDLEKGDWTLTFERNGFATYTDELSVRDGETESVTVNLGAGQVERVQRASEATIELTVTNSDSSVLLRGVTVNATNAESGERKWIITDDYGKGYLRHLEKGKWALTFERKDLATYTDELRVRDGEKKSTTVTLRTAVAEIVQGGVQSSNTAESKRKKLMQYLSGKIELEAIKN
ncbi:MAG: carboxypeptidase regulatory-like domain-containing protein [Hyphomicrobiaceae bacterium]